MFTAALVDSVRSFWLGEKSTGDPALAAIFGSRASTAGVNVSQWTALNYSAVFAAVNCIAGAIASLPLFLYERLPNGGKDHALDDRLYWLLHSEWNQEMSSLIARETMTAHALTWGNAYAEIEWSAGGGPLVYTVIQEDGSQVDLRQEDMIHVPGLGYDGIVGYSVIGLARDSIGLGLATEKFGGSFFGRGGWPGMVAQHPGRLTEGAHERLKNSINEALVPGNARNLLLVEEGIKIEKVGIPPEDAQFLQTREFQITEIARWFNIPPHKLRDLSRATFSNIEQQQTEFVVDTLRPWLVRWEQELTRKLLGPTVRRRRQAIEHVVDGLQRGEHLPRFQGYAIARQWGWMSVDEIRALENLNPLPNGAGETYLTPANMLPADQVDQASPDAPAPAITAAAEPPSERTLDQTAAAMAARQAFLVTAERALFVEVIGRQVRRESAAIRKALAQAADLASWAEAFYARHAAIFCEALVPAVRFHQVAAPDELPAPERARAMVEAYVEVSRADLARVLAAAGEGPVDRDLVEAMLTRWEIERPGILADAVMAETLTRAMAE